MKRIAIALVAIAATFIAMPAAHADKPQKCVEFAALPDSCLDQATVDFIAAQNAELVKTRADRDRWTGLAVDSVAEATQLRAGLLKQQGELADAHVEIFGLRSALEVAYDEIDRLRHRVKALRAKVKALQALV